MSRIYWRNFSTMEKYPLDYQGIPIYTGEGDIWVSKTSTKKSSLKVLRNYPTILSKFHLLSKIFFKFLQHFSKFMYRSGSNFQSAVIFFFFGRGKDIIKRKTSKQAPHSTTFVVFHSFYWRFLYICDKIWEIILKKKKSSEFFLLYYFGP